MTIPPAVKNALKTFSLLLDLVNARPQKNSNFRDISFQQMFLDKCSETDSRHYSDTSVPPPATDTYLNFSPAEMVFYYSFQESSVLSPSNPSSGTDTEHEKSLSPSFLIQFMNTTSDPQASSSAIHVMMKLLSHLKKTLNYHPTELDMMEWNTSGFSWNEVKYKDLKSIGGILAYDIFCGVFDGLSKIVDEYSLSVDERRSPLSALNLNIVDQERRRNKEVEMANVEKDLRNLMWEPLFVDMIYLMQECGTLAKIGGSYLFSLEDEEYTPVVHTKEELTPLRQRLYDWISDTEMGQSKLQKGKGGTRILIQSIGVLYTALQRVLSDTEMNDSVILLRHRLG